jgi:CYTH domain-containing protein
MEEIERKFLVRSNDFIKESHKKYRIVQGFLNTHKERTVRVRLKGDQGYITVKGQSNDTGTTRFEWEREISKEEAENLLLLCEPGVIDKLRYEVVVEDHLFEIDVFSGDNLGLIVAEVELKSESESYPKPQWLSTEVTGEIKYYNAMLSKHPYQKW